MAVSLVKTFSCIASERFAVHPTGNGERIGSATTNKSQELVALFRLQHSLGGRRKVGSWSDNPVRSTTATLIIKLRRIADNDKIGVDNRIDLIVGLVGLGQAYIERGNVKPARFVSEKAPGAYERHLPSIKHVIGKKNTQKIERKHNLSVSDPGDPLTIFNVWTATDL